jgi:hypothetical protein
MLRLIFVSIVAFLFVVGSFSELLILIFWLSVRINFTSPWLPKEKCVGFLNPGSASQGLSLVFWKKVVGKKGGLHLSS